MNPDAVFEIRMNAQGRLVVPIQLRERLGTAQGGAFIAYLDGERIVLERKGEARNRLLKLAARLAPEGHSLTDELLAERRVAARNE